VVVGGPAIGPDRRGCGPDPASGPDAFLSGLRYAWATSRIHQRSRLSRRPTSSDTSAGREPGSIIPF